jgi:hypothetical protein
MLRWAISFVMNRLFVAAIVIFLAHNYFRANGGSSDGFGAPLAGQISQWFGFDQLYRALDHDN